MYIMRPLLGTKDLKISTTWETGKGVKRNTKGEKKRLNPVWEERKSRYPPCTE
jgi:hypothetical protein